MTKEEQTEEVKTRLYYLTLQFVRKYQPRLYQQFTGSKEDLAGEFYVQFLTAKAREKGKEASLLDKFDRSITTLEYLVKVSVQRMLIDRSRSDCRRVYSIDKFTDEYGDCIAKAFSITTDESEEDSREVDARVFTRDEVVSLKKRWFVMSEEAKKSFQRQFNEVRSVLARSYREVFDELLSSY